MRKYLLPILLFGVCLLVFATQKVGLFHPNYVPTVKIIYYQLGNLNIPLKVQQYGNRSAIAFLSLHDDEYTSVEATKKILEKEGGLLIEIENDQKRNIRFKLGRTSYGIDPNRMFSDEGITKSMDELGRTSKPAIDEVKKFAERVLLLFPEKPQCIIALHNNTEGQFSANSYASGYKRAKEAEDVFLNKELDPDDFFITTDRKIFNELAAAGFNTVLQQNDAPVEDGSLSVYCGKKGIRYVNLETEHGKMSVYYEMMAQLMEVLNKSISYK